MWKPVVEGAVLFSTDEPHPVEVKQIARTSRTRVPTAEPRLDTAHPSSRLLKRDNATRACAVPSAPALKARPISRGPFRRRRRVTCVRD